MKYVILAEAIATVSERHVIEAESYNDVEAQAKKICNDLETYLGDGNIATHTSSYYRIGEIKCD